MYPGAGKNFVYPTLGLAGESGEVAEVVKRVIRDKNGLADEETKAALIKELGDVLWYLAQIAAEFGLSFDEIAVTNIEKLRSRKERGMLHGKGDNR
ncbi:MAG: nucleoside triphosphate pyrophosphohydrolase family protein [Candidatus Nealsonbacteria bacterium]|nr:nucleoside triphosphate pyrophosphohydrolase family protein [Candidatus Nealsonbacteria bacterium]